MIQGLLFGGETFSPNQLKREKKKKEIHIFYCAFCSLEPKILYYFKLIVWTLKISNLFFVVKEWLHPLQQTAKALCKKEYIAISFLFLLFSAFFCSSWFYQHFIFLLWESTFYPKGTLNGSLSLFRVLNVWIPSAEKKNERKLQLFIWRLCLTHQLLDDNQESFKLSWQFWPLITEMINAFLRLPATLSVHALATTLLIIFMSLNTCI